MAATSGRSHAEPPAVAGRVCAGALQAAGTLGEGQGRSGLYHGCQGGPAGEREEELERWT